MEDNVITVETETREDNNGGAVEMKNNRDGIQGHQ